MASQSTASTEPTTAVDDGAVVAAPPDDPQASVSATPSADHSSPPTDNPPPEPAAAPAPLPTEFVIGREPTGFEPRLAASTSPYRPDTVVDGGHADGLTLRIASVRGRDKRSEGKVRDDDFCIAYVPARQAIAIAIADGMGSAERGYLGAILASRHAIEEIQAQLEAAPADELDWPKLFRRARSALQIAFRDRAGRPENELREVSRDLGTTLVVAVVQRSQDGMDVSAAAVGDSPCWTLEDESWERMVGLDDEHDVDGFATNEVAALPYVTEPQVFHGHLHRGQVLVLGTDGFGKPLGDGTNDLGSTMAAHLRTPPPLPAWSYLVDFGRRTYGDDRTIAAVWADDPTR